jgi:hypothetical protein
MCSCTTHQWVTRFEKGKRNRCPLAFPFHFARVAEWQTRQLQVLVSERAWGFKSPLAHDDDNVGGVGSDAGFELSFRCGACGNEKIFLTFVWA